MRLFFALWPEPEVRTRLEALAADAHRRCGGRRIPGDKLHLTLAFLGDVTPQQADALTALTGRLAFTPGDWTLDRLGHFARGGVLWAGSRRTPAALATLHRRLWQSLAELGFAPPGRPFTPHVTLLRGARAPSSERHVRLDWRYRRVALVHSAVEGPRRRYVTLARTIAFGE